MVRLVSLASGSFTDGCGGDSSSSSSGGVDDWLWPIEIEQQQFDEGSYSDLSSVDTADALARSCPKTVAAQSGSGNDVVIRSAPDVYGQEHPVETAALLEVKLHDFDQHLASLLDLVTKDAAVVQAQQKCPKLLTNDFKLWFLRCECFQVEVRKRAW
jgi:hypothetical protein